MLRVAVLLLSVMLFPFLAGVVTRETSDFVVLSPAKYAYYSQKTIPLIYVAPVNTVVSVFLNNSFLFNTTSNTTITVPQDGCYHLLLVAHMPNKTMNETIVFFVDTVPPYVKIIAPANDQVINENTIELQYVVYENMKISKVEIIVDGHILVVSARPYNITINLDYGQHTITIIAYDMAGNSGSATISIYVSKKSLAKYFVFFLVLLIIVFFLAHVIYKALEGLRLS